MARRQTESITEFMVEDVRCFEGEQRALLRPITLLVGENSTGKTSFLGCFRAVGELLRGPRYLFDSPRIDFNQEPFLMGSFRDIVRSRRGRDGRINEFRLGVVANPPRRLGIAPYPIHFSFCERGSEPSIVSYRMQFTEHLHLEVKHESDSCTQVSTPSCTVALDTPFDLPPAFLFRLSHYAREKRRPGLGLEGVEAVSELLSELRRLGRAAATDASPDYLEFADALVPSVPDLTSIAPLRSKPKRTYDPVRESASPDGEHVPMLMMRLDRTEKGQWDSLHDHLVDFGEQSGLFSDI